MNPLWTNNMCSANFGSLQMYLLSYIKKRRRQKSGILSSLCSDKKELFDKCKATDALLLG